MFFRRSRPSSGYGVMRDLHRPNARCDIGCKTTKEPARRRRYVRAASPRTGCELLGGTCGPGGALHAFPKATVILRAPRARFEFFACCHCSRFHSSTALRQCGPVRKYSFGASDFVPKYSRTIMKKMKAGKLKVRSMTEDGRVARKDDKDELFGFLAGEVKIIGDVESPILPAKPRKKIKK